MSLVTGLYESRGIVRIAVDGRDVCAIRASTFQKFPLAEGDAVDIDAYLDRVAAQQASAAYEAALTMLSRSARTGMQLERALIQKGYIAPAVEAALLRLHEAKLIDDRALAERMVELAAQKPVGRYALQRKLRSKGVSEDDAAEALMQLDDEQQLVAARQIAHKLAPRYEGEPRHAARAKLSQALARRGYAWDVISPAIDEVYNDAGDEW